MSSYLDIRTLSALTSFVNMILCLVMFYVYKTRKTYPGYRHWVYSAFCMFAGTLLLSLRGMLPEFFTVIAANALIASYFVFIAYGIQIFFQRPVLIWHYTTPVVFMILTFIYFTYITPSISARVVIITLLGCVFLLISVYCVYFKSLETLHETNMLVIVSLTVQLLYFLLRIAYTLLIESGIKDFMAASSVQSITFLLLIGGNTSLFLGLIIMNSQRVEFDLSEASKEIKVLKGILPICSFCKKIRDDKGYWNQIESYIRDHSEAEFSHSICRECAKEHFPDLNINAD